MKKTISVLLITVLLFCSAGVSTLALSGRVDKNVVEFSKKATANLLGKVLYTSSLKMKNAFSRSDA